MERCSVKHELIIIVCFSRGRKTRLCVSSRIRRDIPLTKRKEKYFVRDGDKGPATIQHISAGRNDQQSGSELVESVSILAPFHARLCIIRPTIIIKVFRPVFVGH